MHGSWRLRRGSRIEPSAGLWAQFCRFRFGNDWGTPPVFCEEWASLLDAAGYGRHVSESVQGVEGIRVVGVRGSDLTPRRVGTGLLESNSTTSITFRQERFGGKALRAATFADPRSVPFKEQQRGDALAFNCEWLGMGRV